MCKNFVISPINPEELCYTATDLSCHSTTRKCEQKSPNIVWDGDVHFDAGNGCLNEAGREYYNSQVLPTLKNSEDGKRLHHEDCEPFSDEPADKRCMTVSKIAVNYQNRTTSRTSCWKPTNMKCDPIIKKCICGNDGNMTEIHFQYGNKSQICFLRPTMAWMPGYTCGGRSKASTIFDGTYVCQCKSSYYLPKFNDQCKKWWICKGAQITPTNFMIILFTFLAAIL
ncbi:uncharacterized protein LOC118434923 [Folsomia candida]|nr:uncharacterized protein LOC118434923 [Folsomia candida]